MRALFTIDEIVKATNSFPINGSLKGSVKRVETDSRLVKPGDLFIAIKGDRFDAHDFIDDVIKKGARVVLVSRAINVTNPKVTVLKVPDTVNAMGQLAHFHRMRFNIPIIAITGSAGKTTVKEMLAVVLAKRLRVLFNKRSFNNHIGVPLTLFKLTASHQVAVIECGTNQPGDIAYLAAIVKPTTAILTVIGESHLEKLKSLQGVFNEKWQLTKFVASTGKIFVNGDDVILGKIRDKRVIRVATNRQCAWQANGVHVNQQGLVNFKVNKRSIVLRTSGVHQVNNALLVMACADYFGVPVKVANQAICRFKFPEGRGRILKHAGITIIDDAYNANPVSMRAAVDLLALLNVTGRRILVAGDMRELGGQTVRLHQQMGDYIASRKVDILVTVGDAAKHIATRVKSKKSLCTVLSLANVNETIAHVPGLLKAGDAILVKGSHSLQLEKLVHQLAY